jgi:hypothetical protein
MHVLNEPKHCGILTALGFLVALEEEGAESALEEVKTVSAPAERWEWRAAAATLQWEREE